MTADERDDGAGGGDASEDAGVVRALDAATVDRIAAGEVVERPASVVKELVENSLDADADEVRVSVAGDGTDEIVVRDDGVGMRARDLEVAVEQHTTSKLRDAEDLESGIGTLGFRGEALHTIGAVSKTTITTTPRAGERRGAELTIEGGAVGEVEPAGRPPGTTVAVRDLFYNTPARREFLKTPATEFARVNRIVSRYALANPGVAVRLTHDDRETFSTPGRGDVLEAILAVYGRDVAEAMVRVDATPETDAVDRITGYVSHPETTRSTREYLATFVNGRYVSDRALREPVIEAYGGQLASDRFPFVVLDVTLDPSRVDANVHPRKTEVRFDDESAVRDAIETAVRDALLDEGIVRSRAPRGKSQPEDATLATDFDDADTAATTDTADSADADAGANPPTVSGKSAGSTSPSRSPSSPTPAYSAGDSPSNASSAERSGSSDRSGPSGSSATSRSAASSGSSRESRPSSANVEPGTSARVRPAGRNAKLADDGARENEGVPERESLPNLRVLGQLHGTYVVAETERGLVLIDQHAADERVRYEELRARLAARPDSQRLVAPVDVSLTAAEAAVFEDALSDLDALGFDAHLDGRTAVVEAVPAVFGSVLDPDLVADVLAGATEEAAGDDVLDAADALLADMACKPAIKGNTSLPEGDVTALLERLDGCENPWSCPHGRPVVVELGGDELDARFERDYPGHADRAPE
ncbi:DNA mismatch repair endonuclease MutL [Halocalculus aciditolerans]|nr:DNA mismatch repair endonuclease MutL [Halocalculus aciditolerans]